MGLFSKAKKLAKKAQKNVNRVTEATHVSALKDVGNLAGSEGLLRDPKAYVEGVKSGVTDDLGTGARVMGSFFTGKWGDLASEAGGDAAQAFGTDSKTKQSWASMGRKGGEAYGKAKQYEGAYNKANQGDYSGALTDIEKQGGALGGMAGKAKQGVEIYNTAESALQDIQAGDGMDALQSMRNLPGPVGQAATDASRVARQAEEAYTMANHFDPMTAGDMLVDKATTTAYKAADKSIASARRAQARGLGGIGARLTGGVPKSFGSADDLAAAPTIAKRSIIDDFLGIFGL